MALDPIASDGNRGTFEVPERLMNKDDVMNIVKIMGLRNASVNNYDKLPRPPGGGAGIVNPFRAEERLPFLEPQVKGESVATPKPNEPLSNAVRGLQGNKEVPRRDYRYIFAELEISGYSFMPVYSQCFYELVGTEAREPKVNISEEGTECPEVLAPFTLVSTEVKKRAAWSWYRTHLLYLKSVDQIEAGGPNQEALGLRDMGSIRSIAKIEAILSELRSKANNAKMHALELYPQLLTEEDVQRPSWGSIFSIDDQNYYEELATNYERVQVFGMAQQYKGQAMIYLCEAISLYLEWKENNPGMRDKYTSNANFRQIHLPTFGGSGGPARVWAEAAKWYQSEEAEPRSKTRFREWYLRAVMARGHAEWLLEDYKSTITASDQTGVTRPHMEHSRLLPPPPVPYYVNDCGPRALLAALCSREELTDSSLYGDDCYFTEYIKMMVKTSELSYLTSGERNYNFAFGAPDSFYLKKAKEGWVANWLGLYPMDTSALNIMTGYYERYRRTGLLDALPSSTSDYEKALAVCADDIILEWEYERYISGFPFLSQKEPTILPDLESDISQLVDVRMLMTEAQAVRFGFQEKLTNAIKHHLSRMDKVLTSSRIWYTEPDAGLMSAARIERILQIMISPWYSVSIRVHTWTRDWYHIPVLGPAGGEDMEKSMSREDFVKLLLVSQSLYIVVTYNRLHRIYETLERCRDSILSGRRLDDEEWLFSSCFRGYLETSDERQLPLLKTGIEPKRERTLAMFRKDEIYPCDGHCGCGYEESEKKGLRESAFRRSDDPQAVRQRKIIKQAFAKQDSQNGPETVREGQLRTQMSQIILSRAPYTEALRENLANDPRYLVDPGEAATQLSGDQDVAPSSGRYEADSSTDIRQQAANNRCAPSPESVTPVTSESRTGERLRPECKPFEVVGDCWDHTDTRASQEDAINVNDAVNDTDVIFTSNPTVDFKAGNQHVPGSNPQGVALPIREARRPGRLSRAFHKIMQNHK